MIDREELIRIAKARLRDAEMLFEAGRFDGAAYLCGYAVELKLKARICRTLRWDEFPSTRNEFRDFTSFRTHDLRILLALSGVKARITAQFGSEWNVIAEWEPEMRYNPVGTITGPEAREMLVAAKTLMRVL